MRYAHFATSTGTKQSPKSTGEFRMKMTVKHWAGLLAIIFLLLLGPYFYIFNYSLSGNSQDWANFGTYVGGTLGPIGAFLAFWGLMQQNKMYREHAEIDRISNKLLIIDNEITTLCSKCLMPPLVRPSASSPNVEPDYLEPLLSVNDPKAKALIPEKKHENYLEIKVNLRGDKQQHKNYRVLCSIESKLKLLNNYLRAIQYMESAKSEIDHFNERYKFLLAEMYKKGWVNFERFGE